MALNSLRQEEELQHVVVVISGAGVLAQAKAVIWRHLYVSQHFKAKITHRSRKDTECMDSRSAVEEEVKLPRAINHIQSDVVTEIGGGAAQKYLFNPFFLHSYFIRSALFSLGDVAKHFSGVKTLVNPGEQRLHT